MINHNDKPRCLFCDWYVPNGETDGHCHLDPPVVQFHGAQVMSMFPAVEADSFCSYHSAFDDNDDDTELDPSRN